MKKIFFTLTMILSIIYTLDAQIPQGFNYQAIARDANGEVHSKTSIHVIAQILAESANGLVVWEEKHDVITNEFGLFNLILCGDDELRTGGTVSTISDIPWGTGNYFLDLQVDAGQGPVELGATPLRSVPYSLVSGATIQNMNTLEIQPTNTVQGEALFIVKREDGFPIFAVYEDGVRVFTDDNVTGKGVKGGFAVGGYNTGKGTGQTYLNVTPDSTRIYVNDIPGKGIKGGFAVGGYNTGKGVSQTFMSVTPDSTRIYVNDIPVKGVKGGFAVGGYNTGKASPGMTYMAVTPDSTRIYVNDIPGKGLKGGFAVGGYNTGKKGLPQEYLRVTQDSTRVFVNSNPLKGIKGGFAVGGYNTGKAEDGTFMSLTRENYFIGHNSGSRITGGRFNSVMGYESGLNISDGNSNVFLGYQSGFSNSKGNNNAFLGYQSGYSNTDGGGNLFLGYQSGYSNESGYNNTFVGNSAGYKNNGINNTFLGSFSGYNNVSGAFNTFVGDSTGFSNLLGYSNTFMGTSAGLSNTSGYSNLFIGKWAGYSNTVGSFNVFLGHESGYSNTTGGDNVFLGDSAGYSNVGGYSNTFLGSRAGSNNSSGFSNVMIGTAAGFLSDSAGFNVFLGHESGYSNINGYANTFIGANAGHGNVVGFSNVMIGTDAGLVSDSSAFNVFLGHESGKSNTSGGQNIFIGYHSGFTNDIGGNSVYIGTHAGNDNKEGEGNVFLGYKAGYNSNGSQNVFIGNRAGSSQHGNGKLHISNQEADSTKALIFGDFYAPTLRFNARVGLNMNPDWNLLSMYKTDEAGRIAIYGKGSDYDYSAVELHADTSGGNNFYSIKHTINNSFEVQQTAGEIYTTRFIIDSIGHTAINGYPNNQTLNIHDGIGSSQLGLAGTGDDFDYALISLETSGLAVNRNYALKHAKDNSFSIAYWNGTDYFTRLNISEYGLFRMTDSLSVNGWDATEVLDVNGNARFRGVGSATGGMDLLITPEGVLTTSTSDARLKEDFQPLANGLEKVLNMNGMTFKWKKDDEGARDAGLVAQDVAQIFPEAVFVNPNDGFYGINYSRFPALFVEAFKEQQKIIEEQKSEIDDLKVRLEKLESLMVR